MDTLIRYREKIKQLLREYAEISTQDPHVRDVPIFDDEHQRYLLMAMGWEGERYVYFPVIQVDIINDKVWLQCNNTDQPIADELIALGVDCHDIVLGFQPEHLRTHTGFAVN